MSDNLLHSSPLKKFKNILILTIAGIVNAVGVTMFLSPVHLYDSGFSGTSMLLSSLTPSFLPLSFFLIVINFPFFMYGYKAQGKTFTLNSIYTITIYSLSSFIIVNVLPIDVTASSPFGGTDLFLCAIFGGIISGIGSGLTIRFGGAIDGVEVMAVIFAKRLNLTVGTFVMIYNVFLYVIVGIVFGDYTLPLYSIVTYAAGIKTIDFIVEGFDKAKSAIIITNKAGEIGKALSEYFGKGITILEGHGFYSKENKTVIYFVVNRFQISKLKSIVSSIDKNAFITISEVSDVLGNSL